MKYFLIVLTILSSLSIRAQSAEDSVKSVVNDMFTAMRTADTTLLRSVFSPSIVFQTVTKKDGNIVTKNEDANGFISYLGTQKEGVLDERIRFGSINIDGPLASVWTPYSFYANGKFSHCGVNSFQLVRFAAGWKIQYIIDTRRREGCE